jgi:steroid 5-alpha reductase family enzyme
VIAGLLVLFIYFLPTFIAMSRGHPNRMPIAIVNLLLGLTLFGYVGALAWSLTAFENRRKRPAPVHVIIDEGLWH